MGREENSVDSIQWLANHADVLPRSWFPRLVPSSVAGCAADAKGSGADACAAGFTRVAATAAAAYTPRNP